MILAKYLNEFWAIYRQNKKFELYINFDRLLFDNIFNFQR